MRYPHGFVVFLECFIEKHLVTRKLGKYFSSLKWGGAYVLWCVWNTESLQEYHWKYVILMLCTAQVRGFGFESRKFYLQKWLLPKNDLTIKLERRQGYSTLINGLLDVNVTCYGWEIVVFFFQRHFIDYGGERCCKIPFLWAPILSCIVIKYHQNIESITGYGSLNTLKVSLLFVIRGSEISASHFFHLQLKMCRSYWLKPKLYVNFC